MDIGTIRRINIDTEMKGAYLDYAMSVITARALPDVRDGLKPVQRRILYAMYDMGLRPNRPYKKSARIVGEVLGKYHPHGDSAVYDAMVRLAQDFSMRYPLVDGQGNFGSVDGDNAAAMRYTEARLAAIAMEILTDIDRDTVDFVDNFDGTLQEPEVLPARLPNLLLNGASGIAVGMATNIPPHNLREVCDALIYLIDHYDQADEVTVDDLMKFIKGPDFPTSGAILGTDGIRTAYVTGRGRIIMRATAYIEEMDGGRHRVIVTELPYQVRKSTLVERIAELVRAGRLDSISDLRDESDRTGMRIVIELKRSAIPRITLNKLLKHTQMQTTFGANMLALVDGEPRVLSLRRMLLAHLEHRQEVIRRRTEYELERARRRAHVLEGLLIALDNLDEVIETIRRSESADAARRNLISRFELTDIQAQAILDMQLRRLAALEVQKIQAEHADLIRQIAYYEDLLANPRKILQLVRDDLEELQESYGDDRRTTITPGDDAADFSIEDLIPREDVLISITRRGYVKRVPASTYRTQRRGGRGVKGMRTRETDEVEHLFVSNTLDSVLLFTNRGRVFQQKAYQFPDAGRTARGLPISNLIPLAHGERVTAAVRVPDFERADYILLATRNGRIKRVDLSAFESVRPSGLIAISLDEGDELRWASVTHGGQEVILTTEKGQAIRFSEEEVRSMGRTAAGVNAIRLAKGDHVASMDIVRPHADLLVMTSKGYGKRTSLSEYPPRGRYGKGIKTINTRQLQKIGLIADARVVDPEDEITLISADGIVIRTPVKNIPLMGRATLGAKVMRLAEGDSVVSIARLSTNDKKEEASSAGDATTQAEC
ncbi:MAG: DNA gyrase subunit A [Anaerolineae bacterium]